jgi:hypothetical protein
LIVEADQRDIKRRGSGATKLQIVADAGGNHVVYDAVAGLKLERIEASASEVDGVGSCYAVATEAAANCSAVNECQSPSWRRRRCRP